MSGHQRFTLRAFVIKRGELDGRLHDPDRRGSDRGVLVLRIGDGSLSPVRLVKEDDIGGIYQTECYVDQGVAQNTALGFATNGMFNGAVDADSLMETA